MQLPELTLPQYELTLPVLKKKIKYRPFIVREEKVLLLALQEKGSAEIVRAIKQIISACTFDKLNVDNLTTADIEYLFINIRNKSFGEGVQVDAECTTCQKKTSLLLDMSKIKVISEKVDPEIQLWKDSWIIMRYPSIDETYKLVDAENISDAAEELIASCITKLITGDSTYEFQDAPLEHRLGFVGSMTHEHLKKVQDFILSAPKVVFEDQFKCVHCGADNSVQLEGMQNFFD